MLGDTSTFTNAVASRLAVSTAHMVLSGSNALLGAAGASTSSRIVSEGVSGESVMRAGEVAVEFGSFLMGAHINPSLGVVVGLQAAAEVVGGEGSVLGGKRGAAHAPGQSPPKKKP